MDNVIIASDSNTAVLNKTRNLITLLMIQGLHTQGLL